MSDTDSDDDMIPFNVELKQTDNTLITETHIYTEETKKLFQLVCDNEMSSGKLIEVGYFEKNKPVIMLLERIINMKKLLVVSYVYASEDINIINNTQQFDMIGASIIFNNKIVFDYRFIFKADKIDFIKQITYKSDSESKPINGTFQIVNVLNGQIIETYDKFIGGHNVIYQLVYHANKIELETN
jgi:hypothetical protein